MRQARAVSLRTPALYLAVTVVAVVLMLVPLATRPSAQSPAPAAPSLAQLVIVDVKPEAFDDYVALQKAETIPALQKGGIERRSAWRPQALGRGFRVAYIYPIASLGVMDDKGPIVKALGEDGAKAYNAKLRKMLNATQSLAIRMRADLSFGTGSGGPAPTLGVVAHVQTVAGRQFDFEGFLKDQWGPALKKAGVPLYSVHEVLVGGEMGEYYTVHANPELRGARQRPPDPEGARPGRVPVPHRQDGGNAAERRARGDEARRGAELRHETRRDEVAESGHLGSDPEWQELPSPRPPGVGSDPSGSDPGSSPLERPQHPAEILQHPHAVARRLAELGVAVAVESAATQQLHQLPPGVFLDVQVAHVDLADPVLHEPEVGLESAVLEVGLIRVPADEQRRRLASVLQDAVDIRARCVSWPWTSSCRRTPRSAAVRLHSASALPICSSDCSGGTSGRRPFGRTLTLAAPTSCASCSQAFVSSICCARTAGIHGVVLARAAEAREAHRARLEPGPHVTPRRGRQRNLDAVRMGRPELDGFNPRRRQVADDGVEIPVFRDVVGHRTRLEVGGGLGRADARLRGRVERRHESGCRAGGEAAENAATGGQGLLWHGGMRQR